MYTHGAFNASSTLSTLPLHVRRFQRFVNAFNSSATRTTLSTLRQRFKLPYDAFNASSTLSTLPLHVRRFQRFVNASYNLFTTSPSQGDAVGEDGEVQHFEEFWKADGVGEVFLDELERIPNSVLEAHVSLQLEKKIDPKLAAGAKALVTQSLEYVLTLRSENKAKSTIRAWAPRKRRFLLFWHKINLLNNIEIANATKAAAEQVGDTNEPDVDDAEDAEDVDDTASVSSVDREIDTSFDAEAEAEARAVAVLEDGEGDLLQGGVDVLEDNDDDLESGDDAPEEATQPEGSQLPSETIRAAIAAEINAASPFHMVQATEQNLLTWLRYDVLKSSPNRAYETIMQDIKAIVDLYQDQLIAGQIEATVPNPRSGAGLKAFIKRIEKRRATVDRESYRDSGQTVIANGYHRRQHEAVAEYFLQQTGTGNTAGWARRCDFLMSHAIMGRSEDMRNATLKTLHLHLLEDEEPNEQQMVVLGIPKSKTNTLARKEFGCLIRHKNYRVCPVGALAFHLFVRWHVNKARIPSFTSRREWYDLVLFPHDLSETEPWAYDLQRRVLKDVFTRLEVTSSKVTHTMRFVAAQWAKAAGCTEDSIRIHGRWCKHDRMSESYLSPAALQVIRALAGFRINGGDVYHHRAIPVVEPSETLLTSVFPWVDERLAVVKALPKKTEDIGAQKFLNLLIYLRVVILQDAVLMQRDNPDLPIFRHEVFQSGEFQEYAARLLAAMENEPEPFSATITSIVPHIGNAMTGMLYEVHAIGAESRNHNSSTAFAIKTLNENLTRETQLAQDRDNRLQDTLRAVQTKVASVERNSNVFMEYLGQFPAFLERRTRNIAQNASEPTAESSSVGMQMNNEELVPEGVSSSIPTAESEENEMDTVEDTVVVQETVVPERYVMNRNISTIRQLWTEWADGLDGGPAVSVLEATHKKKWRNWSKTESSFFSRRKVIWNYIEEQARKQSVATVTVADVIERFRLRQGKEISINAISEILRSIKRSTNITKAELDDYVNRNT